MIPAGGEVDATIRIETPRQRDVTRLIETLDVYLMSLYPPHSNHLVEIDALCSPEFRFFVARRAGDAVACGALRIDGAGFGEVKRMFVAVEARGHRLGRAILQRIEEQARYEGLAIMRLETGIHQAEALALYRSAGYYECGPFGEYEADPSSLFMEKLLR